MIRVNLTFALPLPFQELHVRNIQIYEKLILHVQIKQDFPYPAVGTTASKSFFQVQTLKRQLFCFQNNCIVTSRNQCTFGDQGAVSRVGKNSGESFQERAREPLGCYWASLMSFGSSFQLLAAKNLKAFLPY